MSVSLNSGLWFGRALPNSPGFPQGIIRTIPFSWTNLVKDVINSEKSLACSLFDRISALDTVAPT